MRQYPPSNIQPIPQQIPPVFTPYQYQKPQQFKPVNIQIPNNTSTIYHNNNNINNNHTVTHNHNLHSNNVNNMTVNNVSNSVTNNTNINANNNNNNINSNNINSSNVNSSNVNNDRRIISSVKSLQDNSNNNNNNNTHDNFIKKSIVRNDKNIYSNSTKQININDNNNNNNNSHTTSLFDNISYANTIKKQKQKQREQSNNDLRKTFSNVRNKLQNTTNNTGLRFTSHGQIFAKVQAQAKKVQEQQKQRQQQYNSNNNNNSNNNRIMKKTSINDNNNNNNIQHHNTQHAHIPSHISKSQIAYKSTTIQSKKPIPQKSQFKTLTQMASNNKLIQKNKKVLINGFQLYKQLGKGKFGQVYLARHVQTGFIVALKKIIKSKVLQYKMIEQFKRQVKLHSALDHPNIVKFYGFFQDGQNIYLILEYISGGTLFDYLGQKQKLSVQQAVIYLKDTIQALNYMHDKSIAHRDIKPQNIVLTAQKVAKLCDFGWSALVQSSRTTYCGTFDYAPPQILERKNYDTAVDIWCIGVLTFQLLTGRVPFEGEKRKQIMQKILSVDKNKIMYPQGIPEDAKNFIELLVQKDPNLRPKCKDLLKHPFFVNNLKSLPTLPNMHPTSPQTSKKL